MARPAIDYPGGRGGGGDLSVVRVHVASLNTRDATELCIRSLRKFAGDPLELVVGLPTRLAIFVHSDVEFRRRAWLRDLIRAEERTYAAFVGGELVPRDPEHARGGRGPARPGGDSPPARPDAAPAGWAVT
jgi:hypothetical protein